MRWFATALSALLVLPAAAAPPRLEMLSARASGTLTIDEQGQVAEVRLEGASLGDALRESYEQIIRGWRFEPVLEQGRPIRAIGHMRLSLVAFRQPGVDGLRLGVHRVSFVDPPSAEGKRMPLPGRSANPGYPAEAARRDVGAEVGLKLLIGEAGKVERAAVGHVWLLGNNAGNDSLRSRYARQFTESAERVARRWTFADVAPGETIEVPIRYTAPGQVGRTWLPFHPVAVEDVPDWARDGAQAGQDVRVADLSAPLDDAIRLVTRIEPLPGLAGEG